MLPLGLFTFDNPIIGQPKATFTSFSETVPDGVIVKSDTTPHYIYGNESGENNPGTVIPLDNKFLKKTMFKDMDISVTYLGDTKRDEMLPSDFGGDQNWVKGWKLNISGTVPDLANYEFESIA